MLSIFLPRTSGGGNSEFFTVYLTDRPGEAPVIITRHGVCGQESGGNVNTWCSAAEYLSTQQVSSC